MGAAYPVNVTTQHQLYSNATYAAQAQQSFLINQSGPLTTFGSNYLGNTNAHESLEFDIYADFAQQRGNISRTLAWPT